jgi:hypothetical protein
MLIVVIPFLWLAVAAFVVAACQTAARADHASDLQFAAQVREAARPSRPFPIGVGRSRVRSLPRRPGGLRLPVTRT